MAGVEYLVNWPAAQADPALAAALGRSGQCAPFDRIAWWQALAEQCLGTDETMLALAREGAALCALPLRRRPGSGHWHSLGNWFSFWARPVFADGGERLLGRIAGALAMKARRITLAPLPEADAARAAEAFRAAGWTVRAEQCDINHRLELGGRNFATYWKTRPGRLRETVRRKGRKGDVEIVVSTAFDARSWADYEAVYARSWKPREETPGFLRSFAEAEGAAGNLRLGIARIAGRPVAAQFWTVEGGTAFIHKLAHDEAARAHSPGTLLGHAMFEHAIDHDSVSTIDFGTGDDAYKLDWMEEIRPMLRLDMHRPAHPLSWPHLLRNALREPGYPLAAVQHGR